MTTLREFIATRQAEIASQMDALRREERELRVALEALDGGIQATFGPGCAWSTATRLF